MKKMGLCLLTVLLLLEISGCGHAEPVDMEAFRCQDSIETVFEVLGETELQNQISFIHCYEYEKVNLWGYKGTATFYVRDDKETIQYFKGEMMLNDKESLELLSSFSNKYGTVEMETLKNGDKKYYWQLKEANGKMGHEDGGMGFDEITIIIEDVYDEESKHEIFFRDEWSTSSDEAYFEALEESQNPESESKIIQQQESKYDGVTMFLTLSEEGDGEFSFSITLTVEEKWKGAGVYTFAKSLVNVLNEQLEDKGISSTVTMVCDGDLISSVLSYGENEGEVELINVGVWLMEGYQDENFDVEECEQLWVEMENDIYYFLLGDEYMKYKNN